MIAANGSKNQDMREVPCAASTYGLCVKCHGMRKVPIECIKCVPLHCFLCLCSWDSVSPDIILSLNLDDLPPRMSRCRLAANESVTKPALIGCISCLLGQLFWSYSLFIQHVIWLLLIPFIFPLCLIGILWIDKKRSYSIFEYPVLLYNLYICCEHNFLHDTHCEVLLLLKSWR